MTVKTQVPPVVAVRVEPFREQLLAVPLATAVIESAIIKRAVRGVKEPIIHQGEIVAYKRRYSDGLAEFLLKARKPEVYGTKIDVNKTITVKTLSDGELDQRIAQLSERLGIEYKPPLEGEYVDFEEVEPEALELDDLL